MKEGFRQSMAWLHTWSGLVFGWLLFAIFLTGTLAYFNDEITRWMQPEIQASPSDSNASLRLAQHYLQQHADGSARWFIGLPSAQSPSLSLDWQKPGTPGRRGDFEGVKLDPQTGAELQGRETAGGNFFYRFHFELQMPRPWGRWLSTAAAMVMFVALISGIITHKKIFKDFFTFRPRKGQRSWLDGHNALGVLVLPFHLMITFSSLVIFMHMVMPAGIAAVYGNDSRKFFDEVFPANNAPAALGQPAPLMALESLLAHTQARWGGEVPGRITVSSPGDRNAHVTVQRTRSASIARDPYDRLELNGASGEPGPASAGTTPAPMLIAATFYGLHMGQFAGPLIRWLYFLVGLAGTAMIGTGLVIWLGKRQLKHAKSAVMPFELRLVAVLNIASMAGLVLAVGGYFWANRVLPVGLAERADWEINSFFGLWGLSLLHACWRRGRQAWVEQLGLGALLFATIPLLNALTTSTHLGRSLVQGDWTRAGFDLTCLATGMVLGWAAWKMRHAVAPAVAKAPRATRASVSSEVG